jgi:ubiquinone/menaquinone biosynthesis C-methylase UbiE
MGKEIDLLENYPKTKRNTLKRGIKKTIESKKIARKFGKDFFDGARKYGYGGFSYNPKYWTPVIKTLTKYWNINSHTSVLDVGCGKGFLLYDLKKAVKGIKVMGLDISNYAINNSMEEIKNNLVLGNAKKLPFADNSFDIVLSINTIHNLNNKECSIALREISRVSKKHAFITVDAYRDNTEKKRMLAWNLTAKTIMSVPEWIKFFKDNNYNGDYYWFIP